jgi:hypothetical protein
MTWDSEMTWDSSKSHTAVECESRFCGQHRDIWKHYEEVICYSLRGDFPLGPGTIPPKVVNGPLPEVMPDLVPKKWSELETGNSETVDIPVTDGQQRMMRLSSETSENAPHTWCPDCRGAGCIPVRDGEK